MITPWTDPGPAQYHAPFEIGAFLFVKFWLHNCMILMQSTCNDNNNYFPSLTVNTHGTSEFPDPKHSIPLSSTPSWNSWIPHDLPIYRATSAVIRGLILKRSLFVVLCDKQGQCMQTYSNLGTHWKPFKEAIKLCSLFKSSSSKVTIALYNVSISSETCSCTIIFKEAGCEMNKMAKLRYD